MNYRFALHNYAGQPTRFFLVGKVPLSTEATASVKEVSHHIILVDRSGSMYRDIGDLKNTLLKLLTLEEYRNEEMKVSLISYSSRGDMTLHFRRVAVEDVMAIGSAEQESIKQLRVTGLTCISQALAEARTLVEDGELTCVTLHSDGFANDQTPTDEARTIDAIADEFASMSNVFVNTIAYSRWSDFKLLAGVANKCSGVCIQALKIKDVFNALRKTADLLAGQVQPAVAVPVGDAAYQIFVSRKGMKVVGSKSDLVVKGIKPNDDQTVYQYHEVTEAEYNASTLCECGEGAPVIPVFAFARCQLAEGNLNVAKYALVGSRNKTLLDTHAKALTNEQLANFAADLDEAMFTDVKYEYTTTFGMDTSQASVLSVVNVLAEHAGDLLINVRDLRDGYQRRGVKRIQGKRLDDGTVIEPTMKAVPKNEDDWQKVSGFELNRNNATINMRLTYPVFLVNKADESVITQVAGIKLDNLSNFNNYTIVGDGALNLDGITVKIASKKAHRALADIGAITGDFDSVRSYRIDLSSRPLVEYIQSFDPSDLDGVFKELAGLKTLSSIFSALAKGTSEDYTSEQVAALKDHYLSTALYLNFPTTTPYASLDAAIAAGDIDTRLSYKVDIGDVDMLGLGKLHSANKFLERMFTVEVAGYDQKKPNWMNLWEPTSSVDYKVLSARTKLTAVDDFMKPIYEDFLALDENGSVRDILDGAGVGELSATIRQWAQKKCSMDEAVEAFTVARRAVDCRMEQVFTEKIRPLVFFIGSTGLLPDEFDCKALPADALEERHPLIKLAKAEKDGTFFQIGDTILSVYVQGEHFSTAGC